MSLRLPQHYHNAQWRAALLWWLQNLALRCEMKAQYAFEELWEELLG